MITVVIPANFESERRYVIEVLLGEFLGLPYELHVEKQAFGTCFGLGGQSRICFPDDLFALNETEWLTERMLPMGVKQIELDLLPFVAEASGWRTLSVPRWSWSLPNEVVLDSDGETLRLNIDVLGASFFFLARCEEYLAPALDQHQRFLAPASFVAKHGLLSRALVNEYAEVLFASLKYIAPGLKRRQRSFRQLVSHDVDIPFDLLFKSPQRFAKSLAGDILKRFKPGLAIQRAIRWNRVRLGDWAIDPYNTFEWIWRQSESRGVSSAFYFMAGRSNVAMDGDYELEHPAIRGLIRSSAERGHEIGIHPSYESYNNPDIIERELERLVKVCTEEGVNQKRWGCRQHYLRWSARETARHLDDAGIAYDSTLGFADRIGFRCGTCYEYPLFDLSGRCTLNLRERPLLVMDVSLISPEYMGLDDTEAALVEVAKIKRACKNFSGDFTLLWHNDRLVAPNFKNLYIRCLDL